MDCEPSEEAFNHLKKPLPTSCVRVFLVMS